MSALYIMEHYVMIALTDILLKLIVFNNLNKSGYTIFFVQFILMFKFNLGHSVLIFVKITNEVTRRLY